MLTAYREREVARALAALFYSMGRWRLESSLAELGITEAELYEGRTRWPWEE